MQNVDIALGLVFINKVIHHVDVFGPPMDFGIVNQSNGALIIGKELNWKHLRKSEVGKQPTHPNYILDCGAGRNVLKFYCQKCNACLFSTVSKNRNVVEQ
jgi:hypothetical protein